MNSLENIHKLGESAIESFIKAKKNKKYIDDYKHRMTLFNTSCVDYAQKLVDEKNGNPFEVICLGTAMNAVWIKLHSIRSTPKEKLL